MGDQRWKVIVVSLGGIPQCGRYLVRGLSLRFAQKLSNLCRNIQYYQNLPASNERTQSEKSFKHVYVPRALNQFRKYAKLGWTRKWSCLWKKMRNALFPEMVPDFFDNVDSQDFFILIMKLGFHKCSSFSEKHFILLIFRKPKNSPKWTSTLFFGIMPWPTSA